MDYRFIKIFLVVQLLVLGVCVFNNNYIWLLNIQVAFFSAVVVIIGSFVGYRNLVFRQIELKNNPKEVLKEYENKYELYNEIDYEWYVADFGDLNKGLIWDVKAPRHFFVKRKIELITNNTPTKTKIKKLPWYKAIFLSFKGGFNLLRIFGYLLLVFGFLWLKNNSFFNFISYFVGLTLAFVLVLVYLWVRKIAN